MDYLSIGLQLSVTGMLVVFSGLLVLFLLMNFFRYIDQQMATAQERKRKKDAKHKGEPTAPFADPDTIPPEVMVVIATAVATATEKKVHIRRVRYRPADATASATWSRQGRVSIMASHITRR